MNQSMRLSGMTQLYQQQMAYSQHKRKLQQIRCCRKQQLTFDMHRRQQQEKIKLNKSISFARQYNSQHTQITHSNKKLLLKLQHIKPSSRYSSHSESNLKNSQPNPFQKRRTTETDKQNSRIFNKVVSVQSSLKQTRLAREYAKAKQIKDRITRYINSNNKSQLKSDRALSLHQDKNNLASHYNAKDIIKNKIKSLNGQGILSNNQNTQNDSQQHTTFTTQPKPTKRVFKKKTYL